MIVVAVNAKLSWYAARSSGMVAWAIVTASIVWGLVVSTRLIPPPTSTPRPTPPMINSASTPSR